MLYKRTLLEGVLQVQRSWRLAVASALRLSHYYFGRRLFGIPPGAARLCASTAPSGLLRNNPPERRHGTQRASHPSAFAGPSFPIAVYANGVRCCSVGSECPPDCRDRAPASSLTGSLPGRSSRSSCRSQEPRRASAGLGLSNASRSLIALLLAAPDSLHWLVLYLLQVAATVRVDTPPGRRAWP